VNIYLVGEVCGFIPLLKSLFLSSIEYIVELMYTILLFYLLAGLGAGSFITGTFSFLKTYSFRLLTASSNSSLEKNIH
jgi:hypothetical protein